ncbi:MAG TPA: cytochrome P460 family protein [Planctomycetaceae bacterium]|nr:cytochrome P460 family protein [Planctomycetaceae bacterium]
MNAKRLHLLTTCGLVAAAPLAVMALPLASHSAPTGDAPAVNAGEFSPYVTKDGAISRPTDYRETFLHLGTFAVASKPNQPVDEMHNVYARLQDIQAYRRDGKFPDGAALVKEVTKVGSGDLTTGHDYWSMDTKLWFVMIKDAKGRFPGNDLWGDGWGWALFMQNEPARNVATDYAADCKTCHLPAKKDDWLYVRGYPILRDSKKTD